jgi:hypothetical protein
VSVAEAKAKRSTKSRKAADRPADEEEAAEARPARRRKSA